AIARKTLATGHQAAPARCPHESEAPWDEFALRVVTSGSKELLPSGTLLRLVLCNRLLSLQLVEPGKQLPYVGRQVLARHALRSPSQGQADPRQEEHVAHADRVFAISCGLAHDKSARALACEGKYQLRVAMASPNAPPPARKRQGQLRGRDRGR